LFTDSGYARPVSFFEGHALTSVRWNIVKHFYSESKNCSSGSESEDEHELEEGEIVGSTLMLSFF
jgi:hypothetical protein